MTRIVSEIQRWKKWIGGELQMQRRGDKAAHAHERTST